MTKEFPCAIAVQFFLRDDKLDMVVYMRAQHALTLFPYDTNLFATLQHVMCHRLRVACGTYVHFCGTYHYYTAETAIVRRVVRAGISEIELGEIDDYQTGFAQCKELEEELRTAAINKDVGQVVKTEKRTIDGGTFFSNIFDVLRFFARVKIDRKFASEMLAESDSAIVKALRKIEGKYAEAYLT